jgi:surface-anchored protein
MIRRVIRAFLLGLYLGIGAGAVTAAGRVVLTNEHADFRMLYEPERTPPLRVVARDEDRRLNHEATNVVLLVPEAARLELPSGTPFGNEGDSLWILPQNQFADILYLGFSAEQIPAGVFAGPLAFQLKEVVGPGSFFAWQAASFGQFLIKFNSSDGVSEADRTLPLIGSHEHFNWGFSAPGVYALTFEIEGKRLSGGQTLRSLPTTFVFHVLPLPPASRFDDWWPQSFHPDLPEPVRGEDGDPDGDAVPNLAEFVLGTDPCSSESGALPRFVIEPREGGDVATIRFQRRIGLLAGQGTVEIADRLEGPWIPAVEEVEPIPGSNLESVAAFDAAAVAGQAQRFFRVRWR